MRRINNLNESFENEDYAIIKVSVDGKEPEMMALYRRCYDLFMLSNNLRLDGHSCSRGHKAVSKDRFQYSWILRSKVSDFTIKDVFIHNDNWEDRTIEFIEVIPLSTSQSTQQPTTPSFNGEFYSDHYTKDEWYTGQNGYHEMDYNDLNIPVDDYSGHRIGIELEVEFKNDYYRDNFNEIPSNWFYREYDGSLDSGGCEIITIPLLPSDAKSVAFWNPLIERIKDEACSWDTDTCGLHVHIGREILGDDAEEKSETIGKMLFLYHNFLKYNDMNIKIYGRRRGFSDRECHSDVSYAAKLLGSSVFKDKSIKDKVKDSLLACCRSQRYFDINLTNNATIEFRKGRGSVNSERIAMVVEYSELICLYAKSTDWENISYESFVEYIENKATQPKLKKIIEDYK